MTLTRTDKVQLLMAYIGVIFFTILQVHTKFRMTETEQHTIIVSICFAIVVYKGVLEYAKR